MKKSIVTFVLATLCFYSYGQENLSSFVSISCQGIDPVGCNTNNGICVIDNADGAINCTISFSESLFVDYIDIQILGDNDGQIEPVSIYDGQNNLIASHSGEVRRNYNVDSFERVNIYTSASELRIEGNSPSAVTIVMRTYGQSPTPNTPMVGNLEVTGRLRIPSYLEHLGNEDTRIGFSNQYNDLIVFQSAGSDVLRIGSGGMRVFGSIYIQDGTLLSNNGRSSIGFVEDHLISLRATQQIRLNTGGTDHMTIAQNGNVYIGTSPTQDTGKLNVDGSIFAEEVTVQNSTNWPDYVFEEDYELMPPEELKAFIAEHKRLPNIPGAEQMEENGIPVGEMQKKMMEKIEELTLMILLLNDRIKILENSKIPETSK